MLKNQRLEANTVDHYEPSHLDLQCLQIQLLLCLPLNEIIYDPHCEKPVCLCLSFTAMSNILKIIYHNIFYEHLWYILYDILRTLTFNT